MAAVLTIETPFAVNLALELAVLSGETVEQAVTLAIRERLDRFRSRDAVRKEIRAIGEDLRTAIIPEPPGAGRSWTRAPWRSRDPVRRRGKD